MAALTASCIDLNIQGNGAYSVLKQGNAANLLF